MGVFYDYSKGDAWKHVENYDFEYVESYTECGCNIRGNLIVVRSERAWKMHPGYGVFGSYSCFDVSDRAKELIQEAHPDHEVTLSIPDLVVRIFSREEWEKKPLTKTNDSDTSVA